MNNVAGLWFPVIEPDRAPPDKIKVPDTEIKAVNLHGDTFHPEWNYTIKPKP